jgi:DNA replication regulator SLD2
MDIIAAKYKEYNKTRDILSGKLIEPPPESRRNTPRKRKHEDGAGPFASKRQQIVKTPSKTPSKSIRPWEVDPYDSPSVVRSLFTPSKKSLGPTPQKDGHVLGLFDLLQEDGSASKVEGAVRKAPVPIGATPRKLRTEIPSSKHSRTPSSRTKQRMLDAFSTPLKNRDLNGQGNKTPSSVSKLVFSTPSFLRRAPLPAVDEDGDGPLSPQMVRVPRKPLVRGLSSMLAGLRQMEDEAADEDLEALREMEMMEMEGPNTTKPTPKPKPDPLEPPEDILVADSQHGILGGFDDEAALDSEPEESGLGRDGQPLKVYKKKGQKRTTRRVNMKPSRSKPTEPSIPQTNLDSEDELSLPTIPETQLQSDDFEAETANFTSARNFDSDTQSEYTASEGGTRHRRPNQEKKKSKSANKDGRIKTAARKVTALAGQNFKRLKLRNSGAKGGPGHGSRFRRKK